MKTIFDRSIREELIRRIDSLTENSAAQWGKMNVAQMLKHCAQWDEMSFGKRTYKQSIMGKLFGKIALKNMLKDQPVKKNLPTVPGFKITEEADFAAEKRKWIASIQAYEHFSNDGFIHPFFGVMTRENTGYLVYKHADHHLRQFGV
jgi:Protein of unknown function (DUF1569)